MRTLLSSFRMRWAAAVLGILALSSCSKSNVDVPQANAAGLMGFNLVADKRQGITIALSNNVLTQLPLNFTSYTGAYIPIYPNSYTTQAYDGGGYGTVLASSNNTFLVNKYYSVFVTGANGIYGNVVTEDKYDSLSATNGQAYVRYINAIPDSSNPRVTVTTNGTAVVNTTAHYQSVSSFTAVAPGSAVVNISNDGNIQANRTITLEAKKAYTILLIGVPGSTDAETAVQIRYVENGSLTP